MLPAAISVVHTAWLCGPGVESAEMFPLAQLIKNLPAMQETPVWFQGQEDPLERG